MGANKICKRYISLQEEIEKIEEISEKVSKEDLIDIVYKLSELENEIKWSTQKTIMLQAGIIKLCSKQAKIGNNIEERIEKIEKYLRSGNGINMGAASMVQNSVRQVNAMPVNNVSSGSVQQRKTTNATSKTSNIKTKKYSSKAAEFWPEIVRDLKQNGKIVLYTNLMDTRATEINDMTIGIEFPKGMTAFGKTVLEKQENIREISDMVSIACGKEMQIKYINNNSQVHQMTNEENLQNLANESDIPFNII